MFSRAENVRPRWIITDEAYAESLAHTRVLSHLRVKIMEMISLERAKRRDVLRVKDASLSSTRIRDYASK